MSTALSPEERAILDERAAALAARQEQVRVEPGEPMVILRDAGDAAMAIPATSVVEVVRDFTVARLPQSPPWMMGVTVHRGEPVGLIDVGQLLDRRPTDAVVLAVVQTQRGPLAVVGAALDGLREIRASERSDDLSAHDGEGFTRMVTRDLVTVIDVERLARDPRVGGSAIR